MARILGIDVSHHQAELDWHNVAGGGVGFCFIRATEGTSSVDGCFELNWQRSQDVGLYRGASHFARVGADAAAQAVHFHSVVGSPGFLDLPPVLAIEEANGHSPEEVLRWTREFLLKAAELFDREPILYTGHFWREYLKDPVDEFFGKHPLWLAGYVPEERLKIPAAWRRWSFWQYTDGTHTPPRPILGVPACAQNLFAGNLSDLSALCSTISAPRPPLPALLPGDLWPGVHLVWRRSPAMTGDVVRRFQQRMFQLGFEIDPDGAYGPQSKRVCQAFQKERGLAADGIVGQKTWLAAFGA
jgi:lysozyme